MAERTIGVYPSNRYNFRPNAAYRSLWDFLPRARAKIIADQLTYLDFHAWLMENLRHALDENPDEDDWSPLVFSIAAGFYKTDVLLYASVCEAALYSVLHTHYTIEGDSADQAVKECFLRVGDRFHRLSAHETSLKLTPQPVIGHLCLHFTSEAPLSGSEVKFASLIKAGESIGVYDNAFRRRLDNLRDDRNTIHLAKQIERNNQLRAFGNADRVRAKKTTEDLRIALHAFVTT